MNILFHIIGEPNDVNDNIHNINKAFISHIYVNIFYPSYQHILTFLKDNISTTYKRVVKSYKEWEQYNLYNNANNDIKPLFEYNMLLNKEGMSVMNIKMYTKVWMDVCCEELWTLKLMKIITVFVCLRKCLYWMILICQRIEDDFQLKIINKREVKYVFKYNTKMGWIFIMRQ